MNTKKNNTPGTLNPCRKCNTPYAHFEYIMPKSHKSILLCDRCYIEAGCLDRTEKFYTSQNENMLHLHLIKKHEILMRQIAESDMPKHLMQ